MYSQNIFSILIGLFISYIISDLVRFVLKFPRFGKVQTLVISFILIISPTLTYIYSFPYTGTLSGFPPFDVIISSVFGVIVYWLTFFILTIIKVAAKPRFIYCQAFFLISSVYMLIHTMNNISPPNIS